MFYYNVSLYELPSELIFLLLLLLLTTSRK